MQVQLRALNALTYSDPVGGWNLHFGICLFHNGILLVHLSQLPGMDGSSVDNL